VAFSKVPAAHGVQLVAPSGANVPAAQAPVTALRKAVAQKWPAVQGSQLACCTRLWKVPAEHVVQADDPSGAYFPLGQGMKPKPPVVGQKPPTMHGSQLVNPSPGAYRPAAQLRHDVLPVPGAYFP
jgi:hypothetical protein